MDQRPSPTGDRDPGSEADQLRLSGFEIVEAVDQWSRQYGYTHENGSRPLLDGGDLNPSLEPPALAGRPDIDMVMVEALRLAMGGDHGEGALGWKTPDQLQFGDVCRTEVPGA